MKTNLGSETHPARFERVLSSCPICSSTRLKPRWEVNRYSIVTCQECSLVFVQNLPTREELEFHYASNPGNPVYADDNVDCLKYYYENLRKLIEKRFPQPGKLLDVGCSGGWFLDVMKGWECHGNEIIPSDADVARRRYGNNIVTGRFEDYPLRDSYFDVITLQDVFDHFPDPVSVLNKCYRMLRPGGGIIVKVHNISCMYAKLSGKHFYAVVPPSHLFYYDKNTLSGALSKTGFQVVDSRFMAHVLKIGTILLRLSRGDKRTLLYKGSVRLAGSKIGNIKVRKNLHDIITVFATKPV